ncbi:hypothetical protein M0811_02673 [Anaeramoeba ignava]|uniref:Uncharacterized protein n=1 Tax=Anaeramoeba ignava TaxID=1746090 RepID=A0A9Q0LB68_ANAIG|nr:hypothetical protein M0811_02673 [Anaeramoeba ignava]
MNLFLSSIFIIILLLIFGISSSFDTCWNGDSDCMTCPEDSKENWTSLMYLSYHISFTEEIHKAQEIIKNSAESSSQIIRMESDIELHTSLNYFCCHNSEEKEIIKKVLREYYWEPIDLEYNRVGCNIDHDNKTIYLLALMSEESEKKMFDWIRGIEKAISDAGVHVNHPRLQEFHCTMARVTHDFPSDSVVLDISNQISSFGSIHFSWFYNDGEFVFAS